MCGALISWRSKQQPRVAPSTTEAEYVALSSSVQEALWIKQLLVDLNVKIKTLMKIIKHELLWLKIQDVVEEPNTLIISFILYEIKWINIL